MRELTWSTESADIEAAVLVPAKTLAEATSIHNAATHLAEHSQWDLLAVYYDAIDHMGHGFMEYNPPKMDHVSDADFEVYQGVMAMTYKYHDMMLGRLMELAGPHISVPDTGDTRAELLAAVTNPMRALTDSPFGPVIRALLSQIAINPALGDPFRAGVVQARCDEVARVIARGVSRGDLRPDVHLDVATEVLIGPVYFRLMFGGELTQAFAERVVEAVLRGYATRDEQESAVRSRRSAGRSPRQAASRLRKLYPLVYRTT